MKSVLDALEQLWTQPAYTDMQLINAVASGLLNLGLGYSFSLVCLLGVAIWYGTLAGSVKPRA